MTPTKYQPAALFPHIGHTICCPGANVPGLHLGSTHRILRFPRAGEVELEKFDESATTIAKIPGLLEKYVLCDTPSLISEGHVRLWKLGNSLQCETWKVHVIKGAIATALDMLDQHLRQLCPIVLLDIKRKPRPGVA